MSKLNQYYNSSSNGSFGGVKRLVNSVRLKPKKVKEWLLNQDTYTLHKPIRKRFQRRQTIVYGPRKQFQIDLIDTQNIKKDNDGFGFILTCIDVFSKVATAIPIKNKTDVCVLKAIKKVFEELGIPKTVQSDLGLEFTNKKVQSYFKSINVKHFSTQNETIKAAVVERFNRTLKERLWRYFTYSSSSRFVEVLPNLIQSYNNSYHRSIKMSPNEVDSVDNEKVWMNLYGKSTIKKKHNQFVIGDCVRISKTRKTFDKVYIPSWTEELFWISRVLDTNPTTYIIKDYNGDEIKGSFYRFELQKVAEKVEYEISEILKERKIGPNKYEVLVSWRGYPSSFNSYIPKEHIKEYHKKKEKKKVKKKKN